MNAERCKFSLQCFPPPLYSFLPLADQVLCDCRAAATASTSGGGDSSEKVQLQLRQGQQMAAAVARKKEDMLIKLKRLTDKQVGQPAVLMCVSSSSAPPQT